MAAYCLVYGVIHFTSPAGWLPVHRNQLRAKRSVTSMGKLYLYLFLRISWRSVSVSVDDPKPCKVAEPIEMPFQRQTHVSPRNHVVPHGTWRIWWINLWGTATRPFATITVATCFLFLAGYLIIGPVLSLMWIEAMAMDNLTSTLALKRKGRNIRWPRPDTTT